MTRLSIESELKEILENISAESSLLRLQTLLNSKEYTSVLYTLQSSKEILSKISTTLKKSLLPTSLYHLIQSTAAKIQCEIITGGKVRTLLDFNGNILWTEPNSSKIFNVPNEVLCKGNIFKMMSKVSVNHLYLQYGEYLLWPRRMRIISYVLSDSTTCLTSRCTPVIYSKTPGDQEMAVIMETRPARHNLFQTRSPAFSFGSTYNKNELRLSPFASDFLVGAFSPQTPHLESFGVFSPPTGIPQEDKGFERLEDMRITPFLDKNESPGPYKKRKVENIEVSDFNS
jgi:hypothetical protein